METNLQAIADVINRSTTGSVATVSGAVVSVQVPGLRSLSGGRTERFYSTETVRSLRSAFRLIQSME